MPKSPSASTQQPDPAELTPAQRAARDLAAFANPRHSMTCKHCGAPVDGTRQQLFCSPQCRLRAFRAGRKQAQAPKSE